MPRCRAAEHTRHVDGAALSNTRRSPSAWRPRGHGSQRILKHRVAGRQETATYADAMAMAGSSRRLLVACAALVAGASALVPVTTPSFAKPDAFLVRFLWPTNHYNHHLGDHHHRDGATAPPSNGAAHSPDRDTSHRTTILRVGHCELEQSDRQGRGRCEQGRVRSRRRRFHGRSR